MGSISSTRVRCSFRGMIRLVLLYPNNREAAAPNMKFTGKPVSWSNRWNDLFGLLIFLPALIKDRSASLTASSEEKHLCDVGTEQTQGVCLYHNLQSICRRLLRQGPPSILRTEFV